MRSIRKQRGFLLNPYRFAGSTQQGAFSISEDSTLTMAGASIASAPIESVAEAAVFIESETNNGAWSMTGESVVTMAGASIAASSTTVTAEGGAEFVGGSAALTCDGADFDGSNDQLSRGGNLTGIADSDSGILSLWLRIDQNDQSDNLFSADLNGSTHGLQLGRNTLERFTLTFLNAAGSLVASFSPTTTYNAGSTWRHVLVSWDISANVGHFYVDGTSIGGFVRSLNESVPYTAMDDWFVGGGIGGLNRWDGGMAEIYFAPGEFLNFSVESNRELFRTSSGKPANLGADGSVPTGTAPAVYLHLAEGATANDFAVNYGTGGNLTVTGALTTTATSPSD